MRVLNNFLFTSIFSLIFLGCNQKEVSEPKLFNLLSPAQTQIEFSNQLEENSDFNILDYLYFYNGGGVALGDIDNDGLTDIYFTANQGSNRLYRNLGDMQFEDITESAGVSGSGDWTTGVTMADVNADGLLDIYICQLGDYKGIKGRNQLFINNGDNTFTDKANEYGLDFQGFSTQASFFDYDNDGDLDMYLLNHAVHTSRSYGRATLRFEKDSKAGDRLYRNEFEGETPRFIDVTDSAGIYSSHIGYGLAVGVADINRDGCMDIYVCNDFHENDYLYINNCDGTFREQFEQSMGHSSRFSMGNDIADFNNDGRLDIVTLDMLPDEEEILKKSAGEESNEVSDIKLKFGYYHQLARNTLQLNRGEELFSDIALLADMYATDWSWAPLMADFNNDGLKDLFITNGIVRRPNDLDYINYATGTAQKLYATLPEDSIDQILIDLMPTNKIANYMFKNLGNYTFEDIGDQWGLDHLSFSNGAAYGDLDNDGDLDLVVNNINQVAHIYENRTQDISQANYLVLKFEGNYKNTDGIGTKVLVQINDEIVYQEQVPTRGFLSSVDNKLILGLDTIQTVDKLTVIWPNGFFQDLKDVTSNQILTLVQEDAIVKFDYKNQKEASPGMFQDITDMVGINFTHVENNFNDYEREYLIPHNLSTQGPKMAVGDVNGDGLSDLYIGGARNQSSGIFIQNSEGSFERTAQPSINLDKLNEDVDAAFFDADGDGDLDIYVVSGGNQASGRDFFIRDRLYINNGNGGFLITEGALPDIFANGSCVAPADYDRDGDVDLFVGTRSVPGQYGRNPPSYLLLNDGSGRFSDQSHILAPDLFDIGMVTDALWEDYDHDNDLDLIIVGEWMPVTIFKNENGKLENATKEAGLEKTGGWWNAIAKADFDLDGDMDFIAGNLGKNSKIKANEEEPAILYIKDFDGNGRLDPILTFYKEGYSVPFATRDELVRQIVSLKKRFPTYEDFSTVKTINDVFTEEELEGVEKHYAYTFASSYIENNGDGTFNLRELPIMAQFSPVYAFLPGDFDGDGALDLLTGGNFHGAVVNFGKYDADYGLFLRGDGNGNFTALDITHSGLVIKGQVRDMVKMSNIDSDEFIVISKNGGPVQVIKSKKSQVLNQEIP